MCCVCSCWVIVSIRVSLCAEGEISQQPLCFLLPWATVCFSLFVYACQTRNSVVLHIYCVPLAMCLWLLLCLQSLFLGQIQHVASGSVRSQIEGSISEWISVRFRNVPKSYFINIPLTYSHRYFKKINIKITLKPYLIDELPKSIWDKMLLSKLLLSEII